MSSQEIEDRRQRAREAFYDTAYPFGSGRDMQSALETATQVKITTEMIQSVAVAGQIPYLYQAEKIIKAFCAAAGFEVVQ